MVPALMNMYCWYKIIAKNCPLLTNTVLNGDRCSTEVTRAFPVCVSLFSRLLRPPVLNELLWQLHYGTYRRITVKDDEEQKRRGEVGSHATPNSRHNFHRRRRYIHCHFCTVWRRLGIEWTPREIDDQHSSKTQVEGGPCSRTDMVAERKK